MRDGELRRMVGLAAVLAFVLPSWSAPEAVTNKPADPAAQEPSVMIKDGKASLLVPVTPRGGA